MSLAGGPREPPVLGFARHHCSRREAWVLIPYPSPLCSHPSPPLTLSPAYHSRPGAILSRPGTGWGCLWTGPVLGAREGRRHSPFLHLPSSCLGTWRSPQGFPLIFSPFSPPTPALSAPVRLHQSFLRLSFSVLPSGCSLLLLLLFPVPPPQPCPPFLVLNLILYSSVSQFGLVPPCRLLPNGYMPPRETRRLVPPRETRRLVPPEQYSHTNSRVQRRERAACNARRHFRQ